MRLYADTSWWPGYKCRSDTQHPAAPSLFDGELPPKPSLSAVPHGPDDVLAKAPWITEILQNLSALLDCKP